MLASLDAVVGVSYVKIVFTLVLAFKELPFHTIKYNMNCSAV